MVMSKGYQILLKCKVQLFLLRNRILIVTSMSFYKKLMYVRKAKLPVLCRVLHKWEGLLYYYYAISLVSPYGLLETIRPTWQVKFVPWILGKQGNFVLPGPTMCCILYCVCWWNFKVFPRSHFLSFLWVFSSIVLCFLKSLFSFSKLCMNRCLR